MRTSASTNDWGYVSPSKGISTASRTEKRAVAGEHVFCPHPLFSPRGTDRELDAARVLAHPDDLASPRDLCAPPAKRSPEEAFGVVLREHERVGMGRRQPVEVHGEEPPVPVAHAEVRHDNALVQRLVDDAQGAEDLQRPRVDDGRARVFRGTGGRVEHGHAGPVPRHHRCCREPGRAAPGDHHVEVCFFPFGGPSAVLRTSAASSFEGSTSTRSSNSTQTGRRSAVRPADRSRARPPSESTG